MFLFDLLATMPFRHMVFLGTDEISRNRNQLLFLFKFLRWPKLMILFDPKNFHMLVKGLFKIELDRVNRNENQMRDQKKDNNKIMLQLKIMYGYRVLRSILMILLLSYFMGTIWFIISKNTTYTEDDFTFYNAYNLHENDKTNGEKLIIVLYFAFTTLSTVGFGDYVPKSELERTITAFILLIGVACFSYIMT
jgi:hypothetical protein